MNVRFASVNLDKTPNKANYRPPAVPSVSAKKIKLLKATTDTSVYVNNVAIKFPIRKD